MKDSRFSECIINRILMTVFLFALLFIFAPLRAYGAEYTDDNGTVWEYSIPGTNTIYPYPDTVVIKRCSGIPESGVLEIPAQINGVATTGIETMAFRGNQSIREVILPQGLKFIGTNAFAYCSNLKQINFPSSLTTIESYAFDSCGFETIEFPQSLRSVINNGAFQSCKSLQSVAVNGDVQFTPSAGAVFYQCKKLSAYTAGAGNQNYAASDGVLYSQDMTRLEAWPAGKTADSFTVPGSVSVICESAFVLSRLKSITLPAGLQEIDNQAFSECRLLQAVDIPAGVEKLGAYCFNGCQQLGTVTFHEGLKELGERAFAACQSVEALELPEGLLTIGDGAFVSMSGLTMIYVPDSVTQIGEDVFTVAGSVTVYTTNETALGYAQDNGIGSVEASLEEYRAAAGGSGDPDPGTDPPGDDPVVPDDPPGGDPDTLDPPAQTDPPADQGSPSANKDLQKQTIRCTAKFTKSVGRQFYLKAKAKTPLSYRTSNKKVATVDRSGKVRITGCGTCKIIITAKQTGIYRSARKTVTVKGHLARPVLKGKNIRAKKAKLKWNKVKGATGYKLYIKYPNAKKYVPVLKLPAKVKGVTHRDLSKNRTYSYKLRAFRKVGKKTVYSSYSKAVKVTVKK